MIDPKDSTEILDVTGNGPDENDDDVTRQSVYKCPGCNTSNSLEHLNQSEYRCIDCGFQVAHVDYAATGSVRGVFGWLRSQGDMIDDRYRVCQLLGKGGFAATYLVEDTKLSGKKRALKEIPELLYDKHELEFLSKLHHPSIPDITDQLEADGMKYLVLEFGGNRTLDSERKKRGGTISLPAAMKWINELADVLQYLHSQNPPIIHRDLKPANILLDDLDRIMLIDFGIAKESVSGTQTRTVAQAASFGYSPPEQTQGAGTDQRSDIYAMGATFYKLLTGKTPPAVHERLAGNDLEPPSTLQSNLPKVLDEILLKSLHLNPNRRQQSVEEFRREISVLERTDTNTLVTPGNDNEKTVANRSLKDATKTRTKTKDTVVESLELPQVPEKKQSRWIPLAAIPVVLAGIAGGVFFMMSKKPADETPKSTAAITPPRAPVTPVAPPVTRVAPVSTPQSPQPTVSTAPPAVPAAPAQPGTSAADIFERHLDKDKHQPVAAVPAAPKPVAKPSYKPRPKPKPKAVVAVKPAPKPKPKAATKAVWGDAVWGDAVKTQ